MAIAQGLYAVVRDMRQDDNVVHISGGEHDNVVRPPCEPPEITIYSSDISSSSRCSRRFFRAWKTRDFTVPTGTPSTSAACTAVRSLK